MTDPQPIDCMQGCPYFIFHAPCPEKCPTAAEAIVASEKIKRERSEG